MRPLAIVAAASVSAARAATTEAGGMRRPS